MPHIVPREPLRATLPPLPAPRDTTSYCNDVRFVRA